MRVGWLQRWLLLKPYLVHLPCATHKLEGLLEAALTAACIAQLKDPMMPRTEVHLLYRRPGLTRLYRCVVAGLEVRADLGTSLLEPLLAVDDAGLLRARYPELLPNGEVGACAAWYLELVACRDHALSTAVSVQAGGAPAAVWAASEDAGAQHEERVEQKDALDGRDVWRDRWPMDLVDVEVRYMTITSQV